jgi:RNA polymerase sigma factor (sigma-70 family)
MTGHSGAVALQAMSRRQQRLVESNLPLVQLTLRRHRDLLDGASRPGREAGELFQEGCLALMEAVRSHDPRRHGDFAAFAMARIHFAISRYAHEHDNLIRVPFITQRRWKKARENDAHQRHRPEPLPRVVRLADESSSWESRRNAHRRSLSRSLPADGPSIGELIRECYDRAARRVVEIMKRSQQAAAGNGMILEGCLAERWSVPEPEARKSLREMAEHLGCSMRRVTRCEERFRKRLAAAILADETYARLMEMARGCPAGLDYRPTPRELADVAVQEDELASE